MKHQIHQSISIGLTVVALTTLAANPASTEISRKQCSALAELEAPQSHLSLAQEISDAEGLPDFCQLQGTIAERVGFVMRLPTASWNGKLAVAGCGGFCGSLQPDKPGYSNSINEALKLGYSVIQTDGGHQAESWDTDWALEDETALDLYAGAWMPLAVAAGQAYVRGYYAEAPQRTYFSGCSNGGRLGLFAAQRHPTLFDGIAAGGAIFDLSGNAGVHGLWLLQSTRDKAGRAIIDSNKIPLLKNQVLSQCDGLDGVTDGVVSRPNLCEPELDSLQCSQGNNPDCFTADEIAAIKRLYEGATVAGQQVFPGLAPGSEGLWAQWITGTDDKRQWGELAAEGNLRLTYGISSAQPFNAHDYQLAKEMDALQRLAPRLNATDPDLSAFARAGGKLFYYHGLADPLILPGRAQQYYEEVRAVLGREKLDSFARFVMVPGHGHCWEKPGQVADDFNPLQVIDAWVESGIAPDEVNAAQYNTAGYLLRTRKLCALPAYAHFRGGDQKEADNFECVEPES